MSAPPATAPSGHILEHVGLSAETLPRLPPIKNDAISRVRNQDSIYNFAGIHIIPRSYDKLVHVGESALVSAFTLLLHDQFQEMPVFTANEYRSKLMDRSALAYLSRLYRLPIAPYYPTSNAADVNHQASAYIAYIGAIYYDNIMSSRSDASISGTYIMGSHATHEETHLSSEDFGNGLKAVMRHVCRLFGPIIREVYDHAAEMEKEEDRVAVGANKMLSDWLGRNHSAKPVYRSRSMGDGKSETDDQAAFEVSCSVSHRDRDWHSSAIRRNEAIAREVAAWQMIQKLRRAGYTIN